MTMTPGKKLSRIAALPGCSGEDEGNRPGFHDLVSELEENYYLYYIRKEPGVEWTNITALPAPMRTTLDKLKAKVTLSSGRLCGLPPALCCCIVHGLPIITSYSEVAALCSVRQRFNLLKQEGTPAEEFIAQYFRSPVKVESSGERQNVAIPDDLKGRLRGLSSELGVTESALCVLSVKAVLSVEEDVPPNYQEQWTKNLHEFRHMLRMKALGAEALVEAL